MSYMRDRVDSWRVGELHDARRVMAMHPHVTAAAVTAKLVGAGHTFDDELSARRWVFNKHGELIKSRTKLGVERNSRHPWNPGLHEIVLVA